MDNGPQTQEVEKQADVQDSYTRLKEPRVSIRRPKPRPKKTEEDWSPAPDSPTTKRSKDSYDEFLNYKDPRNAVSNRAKRGESKAPNDYPFEQSFKGKYFIRFNLHSKLPWKVDKSQIDIVENYDGKIVAINREEVQIEFIDNDGGIVEAQLPKIRFSDLPHNIEIGTEFWIVIYNTKYDAEMKMSIWPIAQFCHPSWQNISHAE